MPRNTTKTVILTDNNTRHVYQKTTAEKINDVEIVTDTLVHFLERSVRDVTSTVGKHHRTKERKSPQSPENKDYLTTKVYQALWRLVHPAYPSVASRDMIIDYFKNHREWKVYQVFLDAMNNGTNVAHYAANVLIIIGLEPFINYKHCLNECYKTFEYSESEDFMRIKPYGKQHMELKDACLNSHRKIEKVMKIDDIRHFDYFLRKASMNTCSLVQDHNKPVKVHALGGKHMIHTGPRGGKYILVQGKKVYV